MNQIDEPQESAPEISDSKLGELIVRALQQLRTWDREFSLVNLLRYPRLTEVQFRQVARECEKVECPSTEFRRQFNRALLMWEGKSGPVTDELLQKCMDSRDGEVQKFLIMSHRLSGPQLELLARTGVNRGTRNMARDTLRHRMYRVAD